MSILDKTAPPPAGTSCHPALEAIGENHYRRSNIFIADDGKPRRFNYSEIAVGASLYRNDSVNGRFQ